jgi:hypothetical protein
MFANVIRIAAVAAMLLLAAGIARPRDSARHLRLRAIAHVDPGGSSADVVGHRGHAYLSSARGRACRSPGVRVFDLRRPRRPRLVSTFASGRAEPRLAGSTTEKTIVRDVSTPHFRGALAATGVQRCRRRSGSFQGFALYDVSRPRRPRKLALVPLRPRGAHELWLQPKGRKAYAYVAVLRSELGATGSAERPGPPDLRIYDVTNPRRPVKAGGWGAWRELGIRPDEGGRIRYAHSVITNRAATRAYVSYWDLGTVILDIEDPRHPRYLGRTSGRDTHSAWLADGERVLLETHETANGRPTLYDVSDPARPRRLGRVPLPGRPSSKRTFTTGVHDPKARGRLAFFSWFRRGIVVADISSPARPRLLAHFVPPAGKDATGGRLCKPKRSCPLVWGVYPERRYVLASDMNTGLWVLRLRAAAHRSAS